MASCRKCGSRLYKCKKCGNVGCTTSNCEEKVCTSACNVCNRCGSTAVLEQM